MTWWIPTSWIEDTGRARRVSLFSFRYFAEELMENGGRLYVSCRIRTPSGAVKEESHYREFPVDRSKDVTRSSVRSEMKDELREIIRGRYSA